MEETREQTMEETREQTMEETREQTMEETREQTMEEILTNIQKSVQKEIASLKKESIFFPAEDYGSSRPCYPFTIPKMPEYIGSFPVKGKCLPIKMGNSKSSSSSKEAGRNFFQNDKKDKKEKYAQKALNHKNRDPRH